MKPELNKIEGTVAYILTQNSAKINACGMNKTMTSSGKDHKDFIKRKHRMSCYNPGGSLHRVMGRWCLNFKG